MADLPVNNPSARTSRSGDAKTGGTTGAYRPALDGLLCIAVMLVLYSHFWKTDSALGFYGVRLFFVLSGFLITRILLDARERALSEGLWPAYRIFMARRALRLLPAYYALLVLLLVGNVQDIRDVAFWHLAHASNILFSIRNDYVPWVTAHYWSLSVEEQFYLVWPLLVLTLRERWLWPVMIALVMAGIGYRASACLAATPQLAFDFLPFASLDVLSGGGLLALYLKANGALRPLVQTGVVCGILAALFLAVPTLSEIVGLVSCDVHIQALVVPALVALVAVGAEAGDIWQNRLLSIPPLVRLGRISYGIYLYHNAVMVVILFAARVFGLGYLDGGPTKFLVGTVLTVIVAFLSWTWLERPFLKMKTRFSY